MRFLNLFNFRRGNLPAHEIDAMVLAALKELPAGSRSDASTILARVESKATGKAPSFDQCVDSLTRLQKDGAIRLIGARVTAKGVPAAIANAGGQWELASTNRPYAA